jgi:regulator of protease activity HflC (stomatin/prohibitin superfamily)
MSLSQEDKIMLREKKAPSLPGLPMLFFLIVVAALAVWWMIASARGDQALGALAASVLLVADIFGFAGLIVVNPNQARVLQLFGTYSGTLKDPGLHWINPFTAPRRKVSLRVRNFESGKMKVNDNDGNPIEIAAVVVWKVVETAEAVFHVDDYENYVHVQSEAAVRNLATTYPYDAHDDVQMSLRGNTSEIAEQLKKEIQDRLEQAGVNVIEARISHLAYAPEIASAMLQRQQASAVVAARAKIVEGAVSMVEMALDELSKKGVVELDEERKAAMVSNLMVVLCSEHGTQPVVNTGTLYQ